MAKKVKLTDAELLQIRMGRNDAKAKTLGDYLRRLLEELWVEEEGFSGKRPFGNSGWQHEPMMAVIKVGASTGKLDSEGDIADEGDAWKVVHRLIKGMFRPVPADPTP